MLKEFKEFALKGNMIDLAIGVIIGGAFGKVVDSIVQDLMMPIIGMATGGVDFKNNYVALKTTEKATAGMPLDQFVKEGGNALAWGQFVTGLINFLIIAFCVFMMVKAMNKMRPPAPPAPEAPAGPSSEELLAEIRDLLKNK